MNIMLVKRWELELLSHSLPSLGKWYSQPKWCMYWIALTRTWCISAVDCGTLPNPGNGRVSQTTGTTVGQTAAYSCNTGYNLVGGSTRVCQAAGVWSGSAPTCQCMFLLKFEYCVSSEIAHALKCWIFMSVCSTLAEGLYIPVWSMLDINKKTWLHLLCLTTIVCRSRLGSSCK